MKNIATAIILLIIVVFITGFSLGKYYSNPQLNEATKYAKQAELETQAFLVENDLFEESNCEFIHSRMQTLSQEILQLGRMLEGQNAKQQLGENNYNILKRKYHLMQIKTYILYKKMQAECNNTQPIILYYYKQNQPESKQQGEIIDRIVNGTNIVVLAIEYNYSKELNFLEEYYGITRTPAVVIDYKKTIQGLVPEDMLRREIR